MHHKSLIFLHINLRHSLDMQYWKCLLYKTNHTFSLMWLSLWDVGFSCSKQELKYDEHYYYNMYHLHEYRQNYHNHSNCNLDKWHHQLYRTILKRFERIWGNIQICVQRSFVDTKLSVQIQPLESTINDDTKLQHTWN